MSLDRIDPNRYTSAEFMVREWDRLWTKVWNMGPREQEIPEPGDTMLHTLGKESLVFLRDRSGAVRGFYNVCPHRGNQLCLGEGAGHMEQFQCAFHGWSFDLDGNVADIPWRERFPQLRDDNVLGELRLKEFKVDSWAGWIWFNLDPGAEPLRDFLGCIPEHLDGYHMERAQIVDFKTIEFDCNWKTCHDAFHESYHFPTLHPEVLDWGNDEAPIELLGLHSMMINEYGAPSRHAKDPSVINPTLREFMIANGIDPETFTGTPADVRLEVQARKRARQDDTIFPYKTLKDGQLTDAYHYLVFPNIHFNLFPEFYVAMRHRPHATADPNKMYFDFIMCVPPREGVDVPPYTHKIVKGGEKPVGEILEWGEWAHPVVNQVLGQDVSLMPYVQRGIRSDAFEGAILGEDEIRIKHFNENLDRYLNAEKP